MRTVRCGPPPEQPVHEVGTAEFEGVLGRQQQAATADRGVAGQLGRPFERRDRDRDRAAAHADHVVLFEFVGHLVVGAHDRLGPLPGAAVGLVGEYLGERGGGREAALHGSVWRTLLGSLGDQARQRIQFGTAAEQFRRGHLCRHGTSAQTYPSDMDDHGLLPVRTSDFPPSVAPTAPRRPPDPG